MAKSLAAALEGGIFDPGPVPSSGAELVKYAGGKAALTRQLSGMNGPPRRADYADPMAYKAASVKWRSASRRAQRADDSGKPGKQRRGVSKTTLSPEQRGRVREAAEDRKLSQAVRRGMRARMKARLVAPSPNLRGRQDERTRTVPASGPGVLIPGDVVAEIMRDLEDGDDGRAAYLFMGAFFEAYGAPELMVEPDSGAVQWLVMWPDGEPEPDTG